LHSNKLSIKYKEFSNKLYRKIEGENRTPEALKHLHDQGLGYGRLSQVLGLPKSMMDCLENEPGQTGTPGAWSGLPYPPQLFGIGSKELIAVLIFEVTDSLLAFRGDEPVNEGHGLLIFRLLVFFGIHRHHPVLIE
jgi:hypothetical protein